MKLYKQMKMKIILLLIFLSIIAYSKKFEINGLISGASYKKIYLYDVCGLSSNLIDSTITDTSGFLTFKFTEKNHIGFYKIRVTKQIDHNNTFSLIFNNENIEFRTTYKNLLLDLSFLNSEENTTYYEYRIRKMMLDNKYRILGEKYLRLSDTSQDKMLVLMDFRNVEQERKDLYNNTIIKNKGRFVESVIKATFESLPDILDSEKAQKKFMEENFFNNFNFNDENLFYTDLIPNKLQEYFKYNSSVFELSEEEKENKIIEIVDKIIDMKISNQKMKDFFTSVVLNIFKTSGMEKVFTHVVDKYIMNTACGIGLDKKKEYEYISLQFKRLAIGQFAIDFEFIPLGKDLLTSIKKLNSIQTLILFWNTECAFCKEMMPVVHELYKKYKSIGFQVVSLCISDNDAKYKEIVNHNKYEWLNYRMPDGWASKIVSDYYIYATPSMFLVKGDDLKIILKPLTEEELVKFLNKTYILR